MILLMVYSFAHSEPKPGGSLLKLGDGWSDSFRFQFSNFLLSLGRVFHIFYSLMIRF